MAVYEKTALIGTGLVGPQIGVVLAQGSAEVRVFDMNAEAVDRALSDMRGYVDELSRHGMLLGGDADEVYARVGSVRTAWRRQSPGLTSWSRRFSKTWRPSGRFSKNLAKSPIPLRR